MSDIGTFSDIYKVLSSQEDYLIDVRKQSWDIYEMFLKNVANKLLYSEDEAEQLDLAEQMKSMIVTVEQIKISGAGFILKTMIYLSILLQ